MAPLLKLIDCQDDRIEGITIYSKRAIRENPDSLVVLMPAALPNNREDRTKQIFSRFWWHDQWPDSDVIAFADPALQQSNELNGAWFIHPQHDIIRALVNVVVDYIDSLGICSQRVTFYGSSLGGFGAMAAASLLEGSRAVAEVPQVDFAHWGQSAIRQVEQLITGCTIEEYRKICPEQLSVRARFEQAGAIPPVRLITNTADQTFVQQREFFSWVQESGLIKLGPFEMILTTSVSGHAALPKEDISRLVVP